MFQRNFAAQQRALEHEFAIPTNGGDGFVSDGFVAPNKRMTFLNHSAKKILNFAGQKFGIKRLLLGIEQFLFQQAIPGSAFFPIDDEAGWIAWTFVEFSTNDP